MRRLFAGLEAGGHLDNTLIVLWSDHGQGLLDHGWPGHDRQLYDEAVHVPLIMIWPDRIPAGRDFAAPVELMDLVPTVLGLLKLSPKDTGFEGRDLSEAILGNAEPDREHRMFFQRSPTDISPTHYGVPRKGPMWAVQQGDWKYIEAAEEERWELNDLNSDPGEKNNLFAEQSEIVSQLKSQLETWLEGRQPSSQVEASELTEEQREALRELGYLE